jgi:hypothetical protein
MAADQYWQHLPVVHDYNSLAYRGSIFAKYVDPSRAMSNEQRMTQMYPGADGPGLVLSLLQ